MNNYNYSTIQRDTEYSMKMWSFQTYLDLENSNFSYTEKEQFELQT